jgi:hypothetical protein
MHRSGGRAFTEWAKAAWTAESWLRRLSHSGGVIATARRQGDAGNWRSPPRPREKSLEQGRPYNRRSGKSVEGGRVAEGLVGALKGGNACGAKQPSCSVFPLSRGEARAR